jgi:hypothetical protein
MLLSCTLNPAAALASALPLKSSIDAIIRLDNQDAIINLDSQDNICYVISTPSCKEKQPHCDRIHSNNRLGRCFKV